MSAADVQAVIGNPANFELLVMQLLSADNTGRKQAEAVYEALKTHPDPCLELLLRCLRQSEKVENRSFCAIMLRKVRRSICAVVVLQQRLCSWWSICGEQYQLL
jgi:hypothetical protein